MWGSIAYFFIVTIGLGFLIDLLLKEWKADFFEKIIIRLGTGIAIFTVLGIIFNLVHIPLDWRIFLAAAVIITCVAFYFRKDSIISDYKFDFKKIGKSQIYTVLVLIMFGITAYMYIHGSFAYPWFEDGDPYGYAMDSKYIALEKTFTSENHFSHYVDPYPQGYQIFMGMMYQINDSLYWSMKFFNALIISLSILFFYYFAKTFTKNKDIALVSTFALFAMPCWVGHFVFSLNFNMALIPILLYALYNIERDKNWMFITSIVLGSLLINHSSTSVTAVMLIIIYYVNKVFVEEDVNRNIIHSALIGLFVALLFFVPAYFKYKGAFTEGGGLGGLDIALLMLSKLHPVVLLIGSAAIIVAILAYYFKGNQALLLFRRYSESNKKIKYQIFFVLLVLIMIFLIFSPKLINIGGTGDRDYKINDFFFAQQGNMTNNPIGVGIVLMSLFCVGIFFIIYGISSLFDTKRFWLSTTLLWMLFTLLITLGTYFSIVYIPFRMWTFFALFAALIIGYATISIAKLFNNKYLAIAFVALVVILSIPTSFSQKYWHNTAEWPEHQIFVPESRDLYIWMRDGGIPRDSKVYPLCMGPDVMYGYDMDAQTWKLDDKERIYYSLSLNDTLAGNYNFLKENGYEYTIAGASCIASAKADPKLVDVRINQMINSSSFVPVKSTKSEILFRVA